MLTVGDQGFPKSEVGTLTFFKIFSPNCMKFKGNLLEGMDIMVCRVQWHIYAPIKFVPPTHAQIIFIALSGQCQQEKVEAKGVTILFGIAQ